jgi:hypothetical protein
MIENSFYVRYERLNGLVELLIRFSKIKAYHKEPPIELYERAHSTPGSKPDLLYIYKNENGWCGVDHNAQDVLYDWGALLSRLLKTEFLQVQHYYLTNEPQHESNYLLYYNKGKLRREIKVLTNEVLPLIDQGKKFAFELPFIHDINEFDKINIDTQPELFDKYGYFAGGTLQEYCMQLGIDPNYADETNAVLLKK